MAQDASNPERQTRNAKRAEAREKARQLREAHQKQAKRRKFLLQSSVALAVLAVVAVIALIIVSANRGPGPYPANMASDGVVLEGGEGSITVRTTPALDGDAEPIPTQNVGQDGVPHVQVFVDYHCPHCGEFENFFGSTMQEWLTDGAITLEVSPVAILNNSLGTNYSVRAANAAACVAAYSPNSFFVFHHSLFDPQPALQTEGLSDEQLQQRALAAGATSTTAINECISKQEFRGWVNNATRRAVSNPALLNEEGRFGTPTVLINGQRLANLGEFVTAVQLAQGEMMGEETDESTEEDAA